MAVVPMKDRRSKFRVKLRCLARVRPSTAMHQAFDDVIATENSNWDGFYALTLIELYKKHMRVFVLFPYRAVGGAINRDYLGEVVRVENLADGRRGVAVRILKALALSVREENSSAPGDIYGTLRRISGERLF